MWCILLSLRHLLWGSTLFQRSTSIGGTRRNVICKFQTDTLLDRIALIFKEQDQELFLKLMFNGHLLKYFPQWAQFEKIGLPLPHVPPKCSDPMAVIGSHLSLICFLLITYIELQGWCSGESTLLPPMRPWGSNPGVNTTCELSLLLVLSFAPRGFFYWYSSFPLSSKTNIFKF